MGDLAERNASQPVHVIGADATGKETTPVRSTTSGDLGATDILSAGGVEGNVSVSNSTATLLKVGGSNATGRKVIFFVAPANMRIGFTNAITTSLGHFIYAGQRVAIKASDVCNVYGIMITSTTNVFLSEKV